MVTQIKEGVSTTEYEALKSGKFWTIIAIVLGLIATFGSTVAAALGAESSIGIIVGAIIAGAGLAAKTFIDLGYIKSRTQVKVAEAEKK